MVNYNYICSTEGKAEFKELLNVSNQISELKSKFISIAHLKTTSVDQNDVQAIKI